MLKISSSSIFNRHSTLVNVKVFCYFMFSGKKSRVRLTAEERWKVVHLRKQGLGFKSIAKEVKSQVKTVKRIITKYEKTKAVVDLPKGHRKRATTVREDRMIVNYVKKNRCATSTEVAEAVGRACRKVISSSLVRRRLLAANLKNKKAKRVPGLSYSQRLRRYKWALEHKNWDCNKWRTVMFSDESRFCFFPDGPKYVRRARG